MYQKIINLLKNKILVYFLIRYGVYFLQFFISIIIAIKLDTFYFGLWSFLLLIMSYFQVIDFGIPNSISVLLIQNKNNTKKVADVVKSSYYLIIILIGLVSLLAGYYLIFGIPYFEKYQVGGYFYIICIIISLGYINKLLMTIHRVKNRLNEVSFFQAIIHVLVFISIFLTKEKELLNLIIGSYLIGNFLSLLVFNLSGTIPKKGKFKKKYVKEIIDKGWYLFIYNVSFYLLAISVRTVVSIFYSVEDFAFFSFSFTMANAIVLLLEAMGFVIFPKMVDKFTNGNLKEIKKLIKGIREQYVTVAYGLIYLALVFFPFLIGFIPKYKGVLMSLNITALTIVMYINAFGYNTYLIANNYEKLISKISLLVLALNLILVIGISLIFQDNYSYTILSLCMSYVVYTVSIVFYGNKKMKTSKSIFKCFIESYPFRLLIPHFVAFTIIFVNYDSNIIMMLPLIIFTILNMKNIKSVISVFLKILKKPNLIDV